MPQYGFSLKRILPYKHRIVESVLIQGGRGQLKPVFWQILCRKRENRERGCSVGNWGYQDNFKLFYFFWKSFYKHKTTHKENKLTKQK